MGRPTQLRRRPAGQGLPLEQNILLEIFKQLLPEEELEELEEGFMQPHFLV